MKIRNGFVSNSSSSSFVLVSTKESYDKAIKKLNKEAAETIKNAVSFDKIGTQEVAVIAYHQCDGEYYAYGVDNKDASFPSKHKSPEFPKCEDDDMYEYSEKISGILSDYEQQIKANKGCISISFDS